MNRKRCLSAAIVLAAMGAGSNIVQLPAVFAEDSVQAPIPAPQKYDLGPAYIGGPLPDAAALIPPAPKDGDGSAQTQLDEADSEVYLKIMGSPRWDLAARDADLSPGWFTRAFSCAAGREISDKATPKLAHLVRRAASDFGASTGEVKKIYQRMRPFMQNGAPICTPGEEDGLRANGSYPSGHSAIGYGTALVLANIFPDHAAKLTARGREYGESRAVCNVHWTSDYVEGGVMASATFARLGSDPTFRADLEAARAEAAELAPVKYDSKACAVEAAALGGG